MQADSYPATLDTHAISVSVEDLVVFGEINVIVDKLSPTRKTSIILRPTGKARKN